MKNSYVESCVFCNIALEKITSQKVYSDEIVFAFKDINPVAKTHLLIIPKKHYSKLSKIEDNETYLLGHIIKIASNLAIKNKISKTGYRLIFNHLISQFFASSKMKKCENDLIFFDKF